MSTIKVDGIRSNGDTSGNDAITLVDNNTCTANITNNLSNRNKIINGAMEVAQRGTSSNSSGYQTVDRFSHSGSGWDNAMTQEQGTVASGTTPYTLGFRKSFKITNGDQTGGAGTGDYLHAVYCVEDQDLATSGWNYTSTSSYITLSFWVKSSVAQNFYFYLQSDNGSQYRYVMETGSLTAGQWTKVTKTIPGNSNLVLNNDTGEGMFIVWNIFDGTDRTGTRPLNAWAALDNANRTPNQTQTWYTTNDATWEITGVQLEVSNYATDFEHRPYYVEEKLCKRYFCKYVGPLNINFVNEHANNKKGYLHFPYEEVMRDTPSVSFSNVGISRPQVSVGRSISEAQNIQKRCFNLVGWPNESALGSHGDAYYRMSVNSTNGYITCDAEL
tara:strand:- start:275 stop:1432 length:1158 start_codon:yes stop_codon:yes gene_type:complete